MAEVVWEGFYAASEVAGLSDERADAATAAQRPAFVRKTCGHLLYSMESLTALCIVVLHAEPDVVLNFRERFLSPECLR
jgi:hypothetical protein